MGKNSEKLCRAYLIEPVIKDYEWGSLYAIQGLTGKKEWSGKPVAELWMGSHKNGDSLVIVSGTEKMPMSDFIKIDPPLILGKKVSAGFSSDLPFLFKLLAAAKPLSIQVHPALEQAEAGYLKEEKMKDQIEDGKRNYRDRNHKPELLYAITDFKLMKGFRKYGDIVSDLREYAPSLLEGQGEFSFDADSPEKSLLQDDTAKKTVSYLFRKLLESDKGKTAALIERAIKIAGGKSGNVPELILLFNEKFPGDRGVLSPIFLETLKLRKGDAVFIGAGEMHAYVEGTGFELMANSDNVLRGGLTGKHIDINELFTITDFSETDNHTLVPVCSGIETKYLTGAREFVFSVISTGERAYSVDNCFKGIEIYFCIGEGCRVSFGTRGSDYCFKNGDSFMIPACASRYTITGNAVLYRASVNI